MASDKNAKYFVIFATVAAERMISADKYWSGQKQIDPECATKHTPDLPPELKNRNTLNCIIKSAYFNKVPTKPFSNVE
jgi:hypothetical protein